MTIEYLKFFNKAATEINQEQWKDEATKTHVTNYLYGNATQDTLPDKGNPINTTSSVDNVMKLTMLRYPKYIENLTRNQSESHLVII